MLSSFYKSYIKWFHKRRFLIVLGAIIFVLVVSIQGIAQNLLNIPSPEEADKLSKQYRVEEVIRVADQMDEKLRDQLRFDPRWKPIIREIRQDMTKLNHGEKDAQLEVLKKPAWSRFGARAYPLLDYYVRVGNKTRQQYGIEGIRSLGIPYTTLWLKRYLQRQADTSVLDVIRNSEKWLKEFGLNDVNIRAELVRIARKNLKPKNSPDYDSQFNLAFLEAIAEIEGKKVSSSYPSPSSETELAIALSKWKALGKSSPQDDNSIKAAITYFRSLPLDVEEHLLVEGFSDVEAGQLSRVNETLLRNLAADEVFSRQAWASAELDRHDASQKIASLKGLFQEEKPSLALSEWIRFEWLKQPTKKQIQNAIAYYRRLPQDAKTYILVDRLGKMKAGQVVPVGRALLLSLALDKNSPDRFWAIAELERHGDIQGVELLKKIINGDFTETYNLTELVRYFGGFRYAGGYFDISSEEAVVKYKQGTHAYLLLLGIAERYPDSVFIQACREYGDLVGFSYFGREPRSKTIRQRNIQKTPAEQSRDWQQWLVHYPDHPGADDATYLLSRSLLGQNEPMAATRLWLNMMTQPIGDGDALFLALPRVRLMLDVGLSINQIELLLKEYYNTSIAPLLSYALSVQYARDQDYAKALKISKWLNLTQMSTSVLGTYYGKGKASKLQQEMQVTLVEQRKRWSKLAFLKLENTPDSLYRLATEWVKPDGWKNGYLALWDNRRSSSAFRTDCELWWVCDLERRNPNTVRLMYQRASQNAVALSLYQAVLTDSRTPPDIFEEALYQVAETLLTQFDYFPSEETYKIHPPISVTTDIQLPNTIPNLKGCESRYSYVNMLDSSITSETEENYRRRQEQYEIERDNSPDYIRCVGHDEQTQALLGKLEFSVSRDYQNRIDSIIAELQTKFPQSPNIDDLLFSNYYLSGRESKYLQQILTQYLDGERAAEAKFVLDKQMKEQSAPKPEDSTEDEKESFGGGQSGPKVTALQKSLQAAGFYEAPITGYYGGKTQLTVRKFQRKNGLEATGSVGPDTLKAIQRLTSVK